MRETNAMRRTICAGRFRNWAGAAAVLCAVVAGNSAMAADVTYQRLLNPEPHNWLMVHRDYG